VFDGEQVRPDTNVVVDAGVVRVIDQQIPDRWRNLPVVDGTGATLLPGLIDAHTHTRRVSQLQDALRFGVTTVLDMWSPEGDRVLREAAAQRTDVSDFRSSGILATVPGGHGTEYGIPIPTVSGADAAAAYVGASLHRELELLVRSGVTPAQALTAATKSTADIFHLNDRGRIVPGRRADLLLVRGDPTRNITATRDIIHVWRSGVEFERTTPSR
jgi:imidazolonepropionase-like amidohydrolase